MAKAPPEPLFLARESYQRRRLGDAARLVPFLGLALLLMPVLWSDTAKAMVYIFVVWAFLIVLIAALSPRLVSSEPEDGTGQSEQPPDL